MHRTGAALSSETREFKGQGWLMRRASSTSLVDQSSESPAVSEGWQPRGRSRSAMRTGCAGRGASGDSGAKVERRRFTEEGEVDIGGDREQEPGDGEYLYREKGYGLGMWVDRVIGWSLFSVDDEEDEEDIYQRDLYGEGSHRRHALPQSLQPPQIPRSADRTSIHEYEDESWGDPTWAFSLATQILF